MVADVGNSCVTKVLEGYLIETIIRVVVCVHLDDVSSAAEVITACCVWNSMLQMPNHQVCNHLAQTSKSEKW